MSTDSPFSFHADRLSSPEVVSFRAVERTSRPYAVDVVLLVAGLDAAHVERDLLGQPATLRVSGEPGRVFHGVVRRVEVEGLSGADEAVHRLRLLLAPRLWLLGRGRGSRIFQDRTVPEIVAAVLGEGDVALAPRLAGSHAARAYCVQHQESDLAFVSRLLAEEGIAYAFEHDPDADRERVVLFDDAELVRPLAGPAPLRFRDSSGMAERGDEVRSFRASGRVAVGSARLREFDFRRPSLDLHATAEARAPEGGFDARRLRFYDHHGEFEGVAVDERAAALHLSQHRRRAATAAGESAVRELVPGRRVTLEGNPLPALDGAYTLVRVEHEGRSPRFARAGEPTYANRFACVPAGVCPRPPRPARRVQQVMETATVIGPPGHEIHTDEHGRVRVRFHWDREGRPNEHGSCWIRTLQAWAGVGWGFQFVPRVGMEVVVVFQAGDTDRPLVVGSVANAEHPPPFPLPANKTRSGIRTQTSRGGGGFNELSFEDRAGWEQVLLRAQRDHDEVVLNDQTTRVGRNRTEQVSGSRFTVVGGGDLKTVGGSRTESVVGDVTQTADGSRTIRTEGNRVETVGGSSDLRVDEALTTRVGGRERREVSGPSDAVFERDLTLRVEGHATTIVGRHGAERAYALHVEGPTALSSARVTEITSEEEIVLRVGTSAIHVRPDRIELVAETITAEARGARVLVAEDRVALRAKREVALSSADAVRLAGSGAALRLDGAAALEGAEIALRRPSPAASDDDGRSARPTVLELVDDDGHPMADQRFVVVLANGERRSGVLDRHGRAELDLDEEARVYFPDLAMVEAEPSGEGGPGGPGDAPEAG